MLSVLELPMVRDPQLQLQSAWFEMMEAKRKREMPWRRVGSLGMALSCTGLLGCGPQLSEPTAQDAASPSVDPGVELQGRVDDYLKRGYRPVGRPLAGNLEDPEALTIFVEAGSCYAVLIRLGEGASLSEHARRGTVTRFRIGGQEVQGAAGLNDAGGIGGGCADHSGEAKFEVIANWGSASDKSRIHDLGNGPVTAQLLVRRLDEQEQRDRAVAQRRQAARWEAVHRERVARSCDDCGLEYESCVRALVRGTAPATGSCFEAFFGCLESKGVEPWACLER